MIYSIFDRYVVHKHVMLKYGYFPNYFKIPIKEPDQYGGLNSETVLIYDLISATF